MFSSLGILVSGVLGTVVSKSFILRSILLTSMLIPAYFGNQSVVSILQDSLRQLENNAQRIES